MLEDAKECEGGFEGVKGGVQGYIRSPIIAENDNEGR